MEKSFAQIGDSFNSDIEYKGYFGDLADNTCYIDPLGTSYGNKKISLKSSANSLRKNIVEAKSFKYDARAELGNSMIEYKALTAGAGGAGTTDTVLNPFTLDPEMWDLSRKELPARTLIRRVSNVGPKAVWNTLDSKGNSTHSDAFYGEQATVDYTDSTYSRSDTDIKLMRRAGITTGLAQATQPSFVNQGFNYNVGVDGKVGTYTDQTVATAIDRNVVERTKALMEDEEWAIFNGDSSTNSLEFDGIIKILGTTNTVDKNNDFVTLKDFRTATTNARQDGGYVDMAFTDLKTYDEVIGLIETARQGIVDYGEETEYGFNYVKLRTGAGVIKLIGSHFLTDVDNSRAVWLLDSRTWEMRVLQDISYLPMGRTIDGDGFMVKLYEALICKAIQFNASITEIGVTAP